MKKKHFKNFLFAFLFLLVAGMFILDYFLFSDKEVLLIVLSVIFAILSIFNVILGIYSFKEYRRNLDTIANYEKNLM